jgi:uncharacterized protein YlxW (UPF0749 family)
MKKKNKNFLLIGFISIILGIVIAIQFRVVQNDFFEGSNPLLRSQELNKAYQDALNEQELLYEQVNQLEAQLSAIEESASTDNVLIKNLSTQLEKYKMLGGFLDVQGQGIQITIDNPVSEVTPGSEINIIYDYEMLNMLVNELKAAGAEAIEINGERIIGITEIRTAGSAIMINTVQKYPPFTIEAIGNKETLDGAVTQIFGIVAAIRNKGYFVEVRKSDDIQILKYGNLIEFDYAKIIKE